MKEIFPTVITPPSHSHSSRDVVAADWTQSESSPAPLIKRGVCKHDCVHMARVSWCEPSLCMSMQWEPRTAAPRGDPCQWPTQQFLLADKGLHLPHALKMCIGTYFSLCKLHLQGTQTQLLVPDDCQHQTQERQLQ